MVGRSFILVLLKGFSFSPDRFLLYKFLASTRIAGGLLFRASRPQLAKALMKEKLRSFSLATPTTKDVGVVQPNLSYQAFTLRKLSELSAGKN